MSVSQFWSVAIGVQASTSRMPHLLKGAGVGRIAKQMLRDVRKCGYHGRVMSRTNGDPAILDVARLQSQSNGFMERATRSVEDITRSHKLALEDMIGEVLTVDTAAMVWLVEHCADILCKRQQRERMSGRRPKGCGESSSVDLRWSLGRR